MSRPMTHSRHCMCTDLYGQVEGVITALAGARSVRTVDEQADDALEALYVYTPV